MDSPTNNNNFKMDKKNQPISTLIFMDVEATGLPSFLGKKNVHITEITLIAIDRNDFEIDKSQRILNKLSLCVRPRTQISPGAMTITGLYNDMLENQELFDDTVPKLLKYFFRRLRPPVCLLAHNGRKYDFPLLQAELKRICYSLGPEVFCGDTLEALRSIINSTVIPKEHKIDNVVPIPTELPYESTNNGKNATSENKVQIEVSENSINNISKSVPSHHCVNSVTPLNSLSCDQDIEHLLSEDMDIFNALDQKLNDIELKSMGGVNTKKEITDKNSIAYRNEHTPTSKSTISDDRGLKKRKNKVPDPTFSPKKQNKSNEYPHTDVRRKLFENEISFNASKFLPLPQKMSFSLPKLYHYFFGEDPPQSHYAEADCIALSKVCQQVCPEFLQWIDENSFPFDEINEMW